MAKKKPARITLKKAKKAKRKTRRAEKLPFPGRRLLNLLTAGNLVMLEGGALAVISAIEVRMAAENSRLLVNVIGKGARWAELHQVVGVMVNPAELANRA